METNTPSFLNVLLQRISKATLIIFASATWLWVVTSYISSTARHTESGGYSALFTILISTVVVIVVVAVVFIKIKNTYVLILLTLLPLITLFFPTSISPFVDKTEYYKKLALETGDIEYCAHMPTPDTNCYIDVALKNNNLKTCDLINSGEPSNEARWKCYLALAKQQNDPNICSAIPVSDDYVWVTNIRDTCFDFITNNKVSAGENNTTDVSLCDNITDSRKRFECVANISPEKAAVLCEDATYLYGTYQENPNRCYRNLVMDYKGGLGICLNIEAPASDPRPAVYENLKHICMKDSLYKNPNQQIPVSEQASWEVFINKYKVNVYINGTSTSPVLSYGSNFNFSWESSGFDYCSMDTPSSPMGDYDPLNRDYIYLSKMPESGNLDFTVRQKTSTKSNSVKVEIQCYSIDSIVNVKKSIEIKII